MTISDLILININTMDIKRHMLIFFFISMLVGREKEWDTYDDQRLLGLEMSLLFQ
jgi:hypothetical protein